MAERTFCILGAGTIGTALGVLLQRRGYECVGVSSQTQASAAQAAKRIGVSSATTSAADVARHSRFIFLTTPDRAISSLCLQLAESNVFRTGQIVVHCSGAFSRALLAPAALQGALTACLHPLQSFADVKQAVKQLPGSYICIDADRPALAEVRRLVKALDGHELQVAGERKALYHAAACVMSNSLAALMDTGLQIFEAAGIPRRNAWRAALPLIEGTLANIGAVGLPQALTGPVARGDAETIARHLESFEGEAPALRQAYVKLALLTIPLAEAKGTLDEQGSERLRTLLNRKRPSGPKRKGRSR